MVNEVVENPAIADPLTVANELRPVLLRLSRELRKETEQLGLTSRQATLLWLIRINPGLRPVQARGLSSNGGIRRSKVTNLTALRRREARRSHGPQRADW